MTIVDSGPGADAVAVAVRLFHARILAEPSLAIKFEGIDLGRVLAHQQAFVIAALGTAELYSGELMKTSHAGLSISDREFDLAVEHLAASLAEAGIDDSLIGVLAARLEPLRVHIVS